MGFGESQDEGEEEVVPAEDQAEHPRYDESGGRVGQDHAKEGPYGCAAVDHRHLVQFARDRAKEIDHHPNGDRQKQRNVDNHEAGDRIERPDFLEHEEEGNGQHDGWHDAL